MDDKVFMKKISFGFRHDFLELKEKESRLIEKQEIVISLGNLRDRKQ